jgi:TPR repeat protein
MYARGQGVPRDLTLAYMWLSLAAARGDAVASEHRGRLAAAMTPEQIAEAERLTRAWRPKP